MQQNGFHKKNNKPVYLGLSILEISQTLMSEIWYDYAKPPLLFISKLKIFM